MKRALLLCLLLRPALLSAQVAPAIAGSTGVVTGRIVTATTEAPIAGATIRVVGQEAGAQSEADGRFTVRGVRVGIVTLEVRRLGFAPVRRGDIAVSPAKPAEVTIVLQPVDVQLDVVTVRPEAFPARMPASTPVSTQRYDAEEVRRQPGAQEDVLRAISIAPGVGVTSAARNDIVVRGGAPFENLFVVDNIEVPNINHFGSQGSTGGPISLINIRFVESASLSAGGFGARLGDRTSSATTLTLREGNRERVAGEVNVAATQVGAVLEGPLGRNGSFLANVRQSYLDLLFKAIGLSFIPSYTDATMKATWRPNRRDAFSVLAIGARGTISFDNSTDSARVNNAQVLAPTQDQYFSGLTWKRLLGRGVATTTLGRTYTRYVTAQRDSLLAPIFESRSTEGENSLRTDVTLVAGRGVEIETGTIFKYASTLRYDATLAGFTRRDQAGAPQPLSVDTSFTAWRNGSYLQATWQSTPTVRLSAGVRGDWYGFLDNAVRLAPRLSLSYQANAVTTLSLSGGRYWQAPSYIWLVGDPGNATRLRPFRADQLIAGISRLVGRDLKVQFEVYGKRYGDYPVRRFRPQAVLSPSGFDDATTDIPFGLEPLASSGTGTAYGAELFLQKKLGASPFYGQLSASLNRTRFTGLDGTATRGAFDTPVLANGVLGWRPNAKWEVATRLRGSSGLPFTPFVAQGSLAGTLDFAQYNALRVPFFFAADVRVDRRFLVGNRQFIAFLDLQNVTNRVNTTAPQWNPRLRRAEPNESIGLLPSIGLNFEF
ncbi:TonB-dependent receptor [Gemmatimonas sp.]|uniref:TonB-dependent receptor n=1 Tax=Gemmatimonas sp. TaxID=1962908 RepID=UPI0025C0C92C|nr:TonB-dependent receptor [Gemmatimonas sp.]MCA2990934.1 carboxypeptidase regulatory-like domain-containing protein [Gemmatimonas sp.]